MNTQPIVIERKFNAPVSKVWKAITDKNEMKKWYFDLEEFKAEPGFKFQFLASNDPEKPYLHHCKVKEVVVGKKLSYSWRYEAYPGDSLVTFELFEQGEGTLLKLTHEGVETFATDNPDFAKESFTAGWTEIIHTSLKDYLEPASN